jgi:hypothetical protein
MSYHWQAPFKKCVTDFDNCRHVDATTGERFNLRGRLPRARMKAPRIATTTSQRESLPNSVEKYDIWTHNTEVRRLSKRPNRTLTHQKLRLTMLSITANR